MRAQWEPTDADVRNARITDFACFVAARTGADLGDYRALWRWSIEAADEFWRCVWSYFDVGHGAPEPTVALADARMPGAQWFPGSTLNYTAQVLRHGDDQDDVTALLDIAEGQPDVRVSRSQLRERVAGLAATLLRLGVRRGDRVVGYLPNGLEAVIGMLAVASIGAVWSACGQEYSARAAATRLAQLDPVVLIAADGYRFAGQRFDRRGEVEALRRELPRLRATIVAPRLFSVVPDAAAGHDVIDWRRALTGDPEVLPTPWPVPVEFAHPLWVVFSSGTTGLPKGIVHGHGGVIIEHLKAVGLHTDIGQADTFFWYTSPSWMMWNYQLGGLLLGATIVCYDGSPTADSPDTLWAIASRTGATVLGTSPGYVLGCIKAAVVPRRRDLTALRAVGITGSALPVASSLWLQDRLGPRVHILSISGGTDVVSVFAGGTRTVPVWPGELSAPYLGVALDAFSSDGAGVLGEVGELVITQPLPSMPICFWNDPDFDRYRTAYFENFQGVWRHGDWITLTDHGSVVIHGRSDATLNRHGIRMGSADIYQVVEGLPEIVEALVVGVERDDGGYWMPLFVVLAGGAVLDGALVERIRQAIRTDVSPRHLPDEIVAVPAIPHTRTGKKLELPIKRLLGGGDLSRTVDPNAVDNPRAIDWFARWYAEVCRVRGR